MEAEVVRIVEHLLLGSVVVALLLRLRREVGAFGENQQLEQKE